MPPKKRRAKTRTGAGFEGPRGPAPAVREATLALPERVRKNMDIDVLLLASARRALGARSDTEAVNRALAEVSRADEITEAMDALRDAGGLEDVFRHLDP